jgi:Mrp family chromosome partitioning ATPase
MSRNFELLNQLDAEFKLGVATPKTIPAAERAVERRRSDSVNREMLNLVQRVFLPENPNSPHVVALCSVDRNARASSICFELGKALTAHTTRSVCLIDANPHTPLPSAPLKENRPASFLESDHDYCQEISPNLWYTTTKDPSSPTENGSVPTHLLKQRLEYLRTRFHFIVIDLPQAGSQGDAAVLSQLADGSILVIEANTTRKAAALQAKKTMEAMNIRILGSVLNSRTFPIPERLYRKL